MIKLGLRKLIGAMATLVIFAFLSTLVFAWLQRNQYAGTFLPILMYHQIYTYPTGNEWGVSQEAFGRHMRVLYESGFNTVTLSQIIEYVFYDGELPENPVLITFDDGYLNVYLYGFPILEYFGFTAVSFIVGHNVGQSYYKDTGFPVIPKFCFDEARRMQHVMDIQSHSYDMHQVAHLEPGRARVNMLRWEDESMQDYLAAIEYDHNRISNLIYDELGIEVISVAFPGGDFDDYLNHALTDLGVRITFTSASAKRYFLWRRDPGSLLGLGRFHVNDVTTEDDLLNMIRQP